MTCNTTENGKEKCQKYVQFSLSICSISAIVMLSICQYRYWPDVGKTETHGSIVVCNISSKYVEISNQATNLQLMCGTFFTFLNCNL